MTDRRTTTDSLVSVDRRAFITLSASLAGPLAGCSGETERTAPDQREATDQSDGRKDHKAITRVEGKIEQVFDRVEAVPLVVDGEFAYDLEKAVQSVDYEEMVQMAKDALRAAEDLNPDVDATRQTREYLHNAAKIAFLLVDQRFLIHRALIGGLVFRRAFSEGDYGRSLEAIDEAREFIERLRANGGELGEQVDTTEQLKLSISGLDTTSITSDLDVILEILHWWIPVFEGFEYTAVGMVAVQEANQELEEERYGPAQEYYDEAQTNFSRAESAFDTAHGRGQPLEYLMPIVNDLRCFVPILANGYDDLDVAFSELESGNEVKGKEIARDTLLHLDREFTKCL